MFRTIFERAIIASRPTPKAPNSPSTGAVRTVEKHVDVFRDGGDPGQLGDESNPNVGEPRDMPGGEVLDVGLAVIPDRVAPEKGKKRRRHPGRTLIDLLEVVQDRVAWRLQPVVGEKIRTEHDGMAIVVVQAICQQRVVAKR
jgi:hypothetical protein